MAAQRHVLAHHPAPGRHPVAGEAALARLAQRALPGTAQAWRGLHITDPCRQRTTVHVDAVEGRCRGQGVGLAGEAVQAGLQGAGAIHLLQLPGRVGKPIQCRAAAIQHFKRGFDPRCRGQRRAAQAGLEAGAGHADAVDDHGDVVVGVQQAGLEQAAGCQPIGDAGEGAGHPTIGMQQRLRASVLGHVATDDAVHAHRAGQRGAAVHHERVGPQCDDQLRAGTLDVVAFDDSIDIVAAQHHAGAVVHVAAHPRGAVHELQRRGVGITCLRHDEHVGAQRRTAAQRKGAALDERVTGVGIGAGQGQRTRTLLGQSATAADVVAPYRIQPRGADIDRRIAPVQPGRSVDRLGDVEQAIAEGAVHATRAEIGRRAEQGLTHQVVGEVRVLLPHQRGRAGDQRRCIGRARAVVVRGRAAGVGRIDVRRGARGRKAIACCHAARVGVGGQLARVGGIDRGHAEPPALQIRCRQAAAGARLAGQGRHAGGIGLALVAGREHHQAAIADDERTVLLGNRRGGGRIGPVQAAPRVVHDLDTGIDQILVHGRQAQRTADLVAAAGPIIDRAFVGDDPCRHDLRIRRYTAWPASHPATGRQLGHHGAMPDHIIHVGVVHPRIDVGVTGHDAPVERRMAAVDA